MKIHPFSPFFHQELFAPELVLILGVAIQSCRDMEVVRQAVARGLFMNVAQLSAEGHYVALDSGQHVHIHPSSVLFRFAQHCQIVIKSNCFQDY